MNKASTRSHAMAVPALLLALAACSPPPAPKPTPPPPAGVFSLPGGVVFEANFPRARLTECSEIGPHEFGLVIRPEHFPINHSPWFAFRVRADAARTITVRLRCQGGNLRYRPKISVDGRNWVMLPAEAYQRDQEKKEDTLLLEVGPDPLWVAAQEIVGSEELLDWARTLERLPFVTYSQVGQSIAGRPLCRLDIGDGASGRHVSIIGRQHPPETTGSLALMRFVEELTADTDLARKFRTDFHVLVMPLINPDGVDEGHWRLNLGKVDLNRDWGVFKQPETTAASEQIRQAAQSGRLFLHLDFHSTFKDVFYTQPDDAPASPVLFAKRWLEGLQNRVPEYPVNRSASPTTTTTSAAWAHREFGVPGITYEIGDETDRALLRRIAGEAAREMMALLLLELQAPSTSQ